jgi:hypothetical protein
LFQPVVETRKNHAYSHLDIDEAFAAALHGDVGALWAITSMRPVCLLLPTSLTLIRDTSSGKAMWLTKITDENDAANGTNLSQIR